MISDVDKLDEERYRSQLMKPFGKCLGDEFRFDERVRDR